MFKRRLGSWPGLVLTCAVGFTAGAAEIAPPRLASAPKVAAASNEGESAIKLFQPTPGFKVELFAAEPLLANPVAFNVDEKGRFFVVETFRLHEGVTDIRGHMDWLNEDLANRTADDRLAMMKGHSGDKFSEFSANSDRVSLVVDSDGDGKADRATVFTEGLNHPLDGLAAGVLARKGKVWLTDLPNLWLLQDKNRDGVADERTSLSYGYGVRVGFLGHDLHSPRFGPDGKIYFSIGDRGSSIKTTGKVVGDPDSGTVFRCNPDGSDLEVFAYGLRNPQGLAFDQFGNLFTGDNNSDGGDQARWVYVVEGGDSGWRVGFQFLDFPNSRGPWNSEKMWHPRWEGQAAFLVPPIINIGNGPSGIAYYPGTGMPERYAGHFFMTDFKGGKGSGIHSFALNPAGATFEMVDQHKFIWECLPTDVAFGLNGGLYYSDWVQGWGMTGKGRLYHVYEPAAAQQPIVAETRKLLADGFESRSLKDLGLFLSHPDMRVRQEAQFELADRGVKSITTLAQIAGKSRNLLARVHAIWGLGQIGARPAEGKSGADVQPALDPLLPLLKDSEAEVRAQAARILGDKHFQKAAPQLIALLRDPSPHVQFFSAVSLGKLQSRDALNPLIEMIRTNADKDAYLRHAGVMGLLEIAETEDLLRAGRDESSAVRMAALLVMRRQGRAEIAHFLSDRDPLVLAEAARAINDLPISGAMPELANLISRKDLPVHIQRRALNANYRHGLKSNAEQLASFATDPARPESLRREALMDLADWPHPSGRDRVTGLWRPTAASRTREVPVEALHSVYGTLLTTSERVVQLEALRALSALDLREAGPAISTLFQNHETPANVRVEALRVLAAWNDPGLASLVEKAQNDQSEAVRREALKLQAQIKPAGATAPLAIALEGGSVGEKQSALAALSNLADPAADALLAASLDKLQSGSWPKEIELDLLEAAAKKTNSTLTAKLAAYEKHLPKDDALAPYRPSLFGGVAEEGKKIFFERPEASCVRCHKIHGEGGEVGPDLSKIGSVKNREYLLESILLPNKQIAAGFDSLIVKTKAGIAYAGTVRSENDKQLVLNSPEDGIVTIPVSDITGRDRGLSAMPEGMNNVLSKQDLRNLVEYLSNLK